MCSDSEEDYIDSDNEETEVEDEEPPAEVTGLALAQHYFGPLLSPVTATPLEWTVYTKHRRTINAEHRNVFDRRKGCISDAIAAIERELSLENGTFQKCVSIMDRSVERDDVNPRNADTLVRIYSPADPTYVDVHIKYHCRSRWSRVEWSYSIGYKIRDIIFGSPHRYYDPPTHSDPSSWHSWGGWESICWGYYDDGDNYGHERGWRRIEVAGMGLRERGVRELHEALFGPFETPPRDDADADLAHRRKLVATVRLLFAVLGIRYGVACTDEETDESPDDYMLEGLADKWVARSIRAACGFQLSGDAEAARRGEEERRKEADGEDGEEDEDNEEEWRCVGVKRMPDRIVLVPGQNW